jgi:LPS-assembly protein
MFQLEFKGLTSVGTSPLSALRDNIRGYEALPRQAAPPSRFTNYE